MVSQETTTDGRKVVGVWRGDNGPSEVNCAKKPNVPGPSQKKNAAREV